MTQAWMRRAAVIFYLANVVAIVAAALSGHARGQLAFRFEERQAITIVSSNQLAATALLGWIVFLLRDARQVSSGARRARHSFWALSAIAFLYLMLDESFQFHEGFDSAVARLFGHRDDPMVDGAATGAYGLAAVAVCFYFREEILRYRATVAFFAVGGFFLLITSVLNAGEPSQLGIVLEESAKLLGVVSFLLGHLAAFAGVLAEDAAEASLRSDVRPAAALVREVR